MEEVEEGKMVIYRSPETKANLTTKSVTLAVGHPAYK